MAGVHVVGGGVVGGGVDPDAAATMILSMLKPVELAVIVIVGRSDELAI